jgi:hypothetical protein
MTLCLLSYVARTRKVITSATAGGCEASRGITGRGLSAVSEPAPLPTFDRRRVIEHSIDRVKTDYMKIDYVN